MSSFIPGFHSSTERPLKKLPSLRKARSDGSFLASVRRIAFHPLTTLGGLAEEPSEKSVYEDEDTRAKKAILHLHLNNATTLEDWRDAAQELDKLEGNIAWKQELESPEYDVALVQARLQQLDDARLSCDNKRMMFLVRTALTRHLGGMGNIRLYKHSYTGTKSLIEQYIESALETLTSLLDSTRRPGSGPSSDPDSRQLLGQVLAARQAFGRSALLLSGGGTFGMNHIGVVKALWETRLLPRIISGASAGSIVCSVLCTRTDEEVPAVLEEFCHGDLNVFTKDDDEARVLRQVTRFLKHGCLFDITNLQRVMRNLLGDMTFQEAYNRSRRILNICVSSASVYELPRLLNYVTAPNVIIWSAVQSSCSVPFVFTPAPLLAKDPKTGKASDWNPSPQCWIDGSVDNDLPMTRLAEMFNVNHFIVSQVNPHVVPFLAQEEEIIASEAKQIGSVQHAGPGWLHTLTDIAKGEAMHRMQILADIGVFPNILTKTMSILSQRYSGDITILPEIPYSQFPNVLKNPTPEFMIEATLAGERATWPKLSRIQNHCAIELALDDAVQQLRARVAFSPSQVDLRLNSLASQPAGDRMEQRNGRRKVSKSSQPTRRNSIARPSSWVGDGVRGVSLDLPEQINSFGRSKTTHDRKSLKLSIKSPSPDRIFSDEEKMFSTSPTSTSDEEEDTLDGDDVGRQKDYFDLQKGTSRLSQRPPTPGANARPRVPLMSQSSAPAAPFSKPGINGSPHRLTPSTLTMTAKAYKSSLFNAHLSTVQAMSSSASGDSPPSNPSEAQSRPQSRGSVGSQQSVEADVSGTRAMLLRKRRSMSRGRKSPELRR